MGSDDGGRSLERSDLIFLCEDSVRSQAVWSDRDSYGAHRQVGELWALLRAGCDYEFVDRNDDREIVWIVVISRGFMWFEYGDDESLTRKLFYLPSRALLERIGDEDWYR